MGRKKATLILIDSDGSATDESVSTASTTTSGFDEDKEYLVSRVLAEKERNGKVLYLVAWEGYPVERSTWEPQENFHDPETILGQWKETKERVAQGFDEAFDLDDWKRKKKAFDEAARKRKEKRRRRRLRKERKKESAPLERRQEKQAPGIPSSQNQSVKRKSTTIEAAKDQPDSDQIGRERLQVVGDKESKSEASNGSKNSSVVKLKLKTVRNTGGISATSTSSPDANMKQIQSTSTPKAAAVPSNAPSASEPGMKIAEQSWSGNEVAKASDPPKEPTSSVPDKGPAISATLDSEMTDEPEDTNLQRSTTVPASKIKAPISITQRSNTSDGDLMKNWDKQPEVRSRRVDDGKLYKNISQRYNAEKAGRIEPEPNLDDITLIDLSTGAVVSAPKQGENTKDPTFCPEPNPEYDDSNVKIPLTCPFYHKKVACGRTPCPFLHKTSDRIASFELYEQWVESTSSTQPWPKFQDPAQICPFWFSKSKGCKRTIEDCWFAHWQVEGGVERVHTKQQTCAFWARGKCFKPESQCLYAHRHLDQVVAMPKFARGEQGNESPMPSTSTIRPAISRTSTSSSLYSNLPGLSGEHPNISSLNSEDQTPKGIRVILSIPDTLLSHCSTLEVEITEAEEELKDLILAETKVTPKLLVNGTATLPVVTALHKLSRLSFHASLVFANEAAKERIQKFLTERESAAIIELSSSLLFLSPGERFSLFFLKAHPEPANSNQKMTKGISTLFTRQIDKLFGIRSDQFFELASMDGHDVEPKQKRSVCLLFNPEETPDREMWATYFRNIDATVFQLQMPGAWKLFCMDDCGTIIAHSTFVGFNKVPDFGKQLMARHNVYQLGTSKTAFDCDGGVGEASFEAIQIFPYGTTVLVTDEIFEKYPKDALKILQHIYNQNKPYPNFVWKWKLAGRYGLKNWLLDVAVDHKAEFDAGDKSRLDLIHALEDLCPYELEDPEHPPNPIPDAPLIAMPEWMMEDYAEVWRNDPDNALTRIVDWFAYWSLTQKEFCRRFVVVHSTEVPKWKNTNQHLIFYTPERYFVKFGS